MKKLRKPLLACFLAFLFLAFASGAIAQPPEPDFTGHEYKIEGSSLVLGWDSVGAGVTYQVQAFWTDPAPPFQYIFGNTTQLEMTIPRVRSGHFIYRVRACNDVADPSTCSGWAVTDGEDPQGNPYGAVTIGGVEQPGKWRTFWMVPPPSPPVIE